MKFRSWSYCAVLQKLYEFSISCNFFDRDEEILVQGLELNDKLQSVLAKHDAIASGSPLPPEPTPITRAASAKHESDHRSVESSTPRATSSETPPAPAFPAHTVIDEEDDEEDDFAQLARRSDRLFMKLVSFFYH